MEDMFVYLIYESKKARRIATAFEKLRRNAVKPLLFKNVEPRHVFECYKYKRVNKFKLGSSKY